MLESPNNLEIDHINVPNPELQPHWSVIGLVNYGTKFQMTWTFSTSTSTPDVVSYQYVHPYRSFPPLFKCPPLRLRPNLTLRTSTIPRVALSSALALTTSLVRIISSRDIVMDQTAVKTLEDRIVQACTMHEVAHWNDRDYRACVSFETNYFVKFGHPDVIRPEYQTQLYIYEYAMSNPHHDMPRIPQPIYCFGGSMTAYLVMEFIPLEAHPPDLIDRAARALAWLSTIPPPTGHLIGPLEGGRIRHRFFQDNVAPFPFPNVEALERYMHKAYATLLSSHAKKRHSPVVISGDRLMFAQSDMDLSNFGVDQDGKTVLMDFADIGLLPATFVAHTMCLDKKLAPIDSALNLPHGSNASMVEISTALWMVNNPKLGLDKHGYTTAGVQQKTKGVAAVIASGASNH